MSMKLLMAGLPARDAAALGILAGMAMKGWSTEAVDVRPGKPLPLADLYVIDLPGAGLPAWSASAEAQLLQMLHGKPAVLLHPARDTSWAQAHAAGAQQQVLVWLAKPYGSEAMRDALQRATRPAPRRAPPVTPLAAPMAPPVPRASAPGVMAPPRAAGATARDVYEAPGHAGHALSQADLAALHRTFPQLRQHSLLARIVEAAASGQPQELRVTVQLGIVIHPAGGWAASTAPRALLERVCRQGDMAASLSVRALTDAQAQEWVQRLGARRESLDALLWSLATAVLGQAPLQVSGDAQLRLRGFPDYTRLAGIPDFFIQLAAICVRLPQTLSGLQAAFPGCNPQDIRRFAMLSTVCGLGQLSVVTATPAAATPAVRVRKPAVVPVKQGFFQAMLARLF